MNIQIAYLCGTFSWGGLEINQLRNADWMNKRGHHVSVICYQNSPIYKFSNLLNIPVIIIEPFNKYYPFRAGKKLSQLLIKNHFTHLIIRSNHDLSIASNVKWRLKNKIHVSFFMEMQFGITKKSIFHTIRYHFFDLWSCPLIWLKKQTESLTYIPKNKIKVIPSGIDLSEFKPRKDKMSFRNKLNLPSDKKIIALIGRLDENKNQLLVLKALKLISESNYCILFLGDETLNENTSYKSILLNFVKENNLESQVIFHSFNNQITDYYHAIDGLINATNSETVGMTTIEALAFGLPVIGSNSGGTKEILENGKYGLLFEPNNESDLAQKINNILSEKMTFKAELLIQKAEQFSHHFVCELVEKELVLISTHLKKKF